MHNPFEKPLYLEKFGLKESPYTTNPDERYLYLTDLHQEAISMCGRLISNREGLGLVVGPHGTGKTSIMRRLNSMMYSTGSFEVAMIEAAEHAPTIFQLTKEILESFGQECLGRDTKTRLDQLKEYMFKLYKEEKTCVLMIDEAQQMKGHLLESIRGLSNVTNPSPESGKLVQVVLFAMPSIKRKFRFAPSFANRLVICELQRMTLQEVENMLEWRFFQAGGRILPFDKKTMEELFSVSKGNPRTICGIAQIALELAGNTNQIITPEIIHQVAARRVTN